LIKSSFSSNSSSLNKAFTSSLTSEKAVPLSSLEEAFLAIA
jgi:hypothetical protein